MYPIYIGYVDVDWISQIRYVHYRSLYGRDTKHTRSKNEGQFLEQVSNNQFLEKQSVQITEEFQNINIKKSIYCNIH
jgi:hypothetical protein